MGLGCDVQFSTGSLFASWGSLGPLGGLLAGLLGPLGRPLGTQRAGQVRGRLRCGLPLTWRVDLPGPAGERAMRQKTLQEATRREKMKIMCFEVKH